MNKPILLLSFFLCLFVSCKKDDNQNALFGEWVRIKTESYQDGRLINTDNNPNPIVMTIRDSVIDYGSESFACKITDETISFEIDGKSILYKYVFEGETLIMTLVDGSYSRIEHYKRK